uniref:Uncharacterized protein n=1 Tax=Anguilla anguilla TaxID=7936 RepID=A0A0E9PUS8_ANGAN
MVKALVSWLPAVWSCARQPDRRDWQQWSELWGSSASCSLFSDSPGCLWSLILAV